ncbi:PAQR family membrane homeostasis protein TrhA [Mycobacterium neumannii]|uniref:PAQR family membrane homeostasis protein TrhA n=1 Tax=Mycobacterium neumannii TaxID=2048551 RepID=UPI001EE3A314|nr:hemolysin III family protein [Mycobacterium neumannii]
MSDHLTAVAAAARVADLKPRARGWIHLGAAGIAAVAGAALVSVAWTAGSPRAGGAALVYVVAMVAMFCVSATYHRVTWVSAAAEKWMMRLDHSAVFVFIAATYTPLALIAMPPRSGVIMLTIVWMGATAGVVLKMLWPSTPRWVGLPLYLMLGYVAVWFAEVLLHGAGFAAVALLVAGAVLYNIGALFYGARWPNPWPHTFGHHELFHSCTAVAAACHFAAIWLVVSQ